MLPEKKQHKNCSGNCHKHAFRSFSYLGMPRILWLYHAKNGSYFIKSVSDTFELFNVQIRIIHYRALRNQFPE